MNDDQQAEFKVCLEKGGELLKSWAYAYAGLVSGDNMAFEPASIVKKFADAGYTEQSCKGRPYTSAENPIRNLLHSLNLGKVPNPFVFSQEPEVYHRIHAFEETLHAKRKNNFPKPR